MENEITIYPNLPSGINKMLAGFTPSQIVEAMQKGNYNKNDEWIYFDAQNNCVQSF